MAQVVDSSDEAEEPEDVQEEEIQPEITRYDYKSDEVNVKVTLTNPADLPDNAELSVTPVELSQKAEDQITEEAIKEKESHREDPRLRYQIPGRRRRDSARCFSEGICISE